MLLVFFLSLSTIFSPFSLQQQRLQNSLSDDVYSSVTAYETFVDIQGLYDRFSYLDQEGVYQDSFYPTDYYHALEDEFSVDSAELLRNLESGAENKPFDSLLNQYIAEEVFVSSNERLRQHSYGIETLSIGAIPDGGTTLVYTNDATVNRLEYDSLYRIREQIQWKTADSSMDFELVSKTEYEYSNTAESYLEKVFQEDFALGRSVENIYDQAGNLISEKKYGQSKSDGSRGKLISQTVCSYDSQNRLIAEETSTYGNNSNKKKNVYKYTSKSDTPDYEYYEDNVLRIKTVYSSNESHVQWIYFDDDYSVKATYRNGNKVMEQIFISDLEIKRSVFDGQ